MADQLQKLRQEFPTGYFGCCGMSRARGHADLCPKHGELAGMPGMEPQSYEQFSRDCDRLDGRER